MSSGVGHDCVTGSSSSFDKAYSGFGSVRERDQGMEVCLICLKVEQWCFAIGKVGHVAPDYHPPHQEQDEEWCTYCLCYGHQEDRCSEVDWEPDTNLEWEEPERPAPRRGEPEHLELRRGSPSVQKGEPERPAPRRGEA
ncbi:UNVERIFIED_CONTAM: hypothetical protein FKN15_025736 [Acipenser sinensis]